jgi:PAS domain S-box-containing protein
MIKTGLGQSEHIDTRIAVENAISQCQRELMGVVPQAGIVFAGVNFDHQLMLDEILRCFPGIELVGCTTAGEFSSIYGFSDDSISLMVFNSDDVEIKIGVGRSLSNDPKAAVKSAVNQATDKLSKPASICLALPDGYNRSFDPIMKMLNQELGHDCPVFGGAAGTLWKESSTPLQFFNDEILEDSMPIMVFGGPLEYSFAIAHSWRPIGKQARVTEAEGRVVSRINDFKAVDFYRHYLGDHSEPAREFILAVYDKGDEHFYVRAPIEYHPDGSITFSETIPQGATIQLTEAIRDVMIKDIRITTRDLIQQAPGLVPEFAMAFSCAFRKDILGTKVDEELRILRETLPPRTPVIGFFSYGEIAPLVKGQESFFHGATLVTLLVGQRNGQADTTIQAGDDKFEFDDRARQREAPPGTVHSEEQLELENRLLKRKLDRSEYYRGRLEEIKEFNATMHRKIIQEVDEARKEIQRQEAELSKSEEKYRRIVTTAGQGFILMDEDMSLTDVNDAYCRMIGYSKDELLGQDPFGMASEEFRRIMLANGDRLLSGGYERLEGSLIAKDGRNIPTLIHGSKLRDDSGAIIGNMAFVTDLTEQKKALALAAEVQKSLLPQGGVHMPGLDVAGKNVSCEEIGGDYFDFLEQKDYPAAPFSIVVGDIAGHGVDAALLMTTARAFLRMRASQSGHISDIITEMNRHLTLDVLDTGRFMTLFYLAIDPQNERLQWVRAGHDPAIIYDPKRNKFEELSGAGIALGLNEEFRYEENNKAGIADGQIIALGTDGIWEACNSSGKMFGKQRFRDVIRGNANENAGNILSAVYDELATYTRGQTSEDDITLVVAKVEPDIA